MMLIILVSQFLLLLTPGAAQAAPGCALLQPWIQQVSLAPPATPEEREAAKQIEWGVREKTVRQLFLAYRDQTFNFDHLTGCLNGVEKRANFLSSMYEMFFEETLELIGRSRSAHIQRLYQLIQAKRSHGEEMVVRLTGHGFSQSPVDLWAGFHRATRSIFMDLSRIDPNEWPLIFAHEMLHGLDDDLYSATLTYSEDWRVKLYESDTPADQAEFRIWLEAGLSRGLWAEYRAWVYSVILYREGLSEGLWAKIPWMETTLAAQPPRVSLARHVYDYLDPNFTDPSAGIFEQPKVLAALKKLRAEYRTGDKLPPLGTLQRLFGAP